MTAGTFDAVAIGEDHGERPWRRTMRRLAKRRAALVGLTIVGFFVALSILAPIVSPYDPLATNWAVVRKPPSMLHLFGTDEIGHDILARIIWGSRASLMAGIVSVSLALMIGVPIGLLTGYVGGIVDATVMRLIDAMLAIPFLILAIALAAFLGPTLTNAMIAIGVSQVPVFVRLTRGQVLSVKHEEYIEAAHAIGNSAGASCCAIFCPISSHRCSSRRHWRPPPQSSRRPAYHSSASASSRQIQAGAACSTLPRTSFSRHPGWRFRRGWRSPAWYCR
jgi:peptide/nickel transport system permease protein